MSVGVTINPMKRSSSGPKHHEILPYLLTRECCSPTKVILLFLFSAVGAAKVIGCHFMGTVLVPESGEDFRQPETSE